MIDVHCHLLPGIDDGAVDLEDALALCRLGVENGNTHCVLTPHVHPGRWENDRSTIASAMEQLGAALAQENSSLAIAMACEARLDYQLIPMIEEGRLPFLGSLDGYQVLLLELPHSHVPPGSDKFVQWLLRRNVRPMIAHPERNKEIMRRFDRAQPFVDLGCLFQLTAGSVAGAFGDAAKASARQFLERGLATVMASDAHNLRARPPDLRYGVREAARIVGAAEAERLVREAPWSIVGSLFDPEPAAAAHLR